MIFKEPRWKSYIVQTITPIFTPKQCQDIINIGRSMPPKMGGIGVGDNLDNKEIIKVEIVDAINKWLPFVEVQEIRITMDENDAIGKNKLNIYASFNIKQSPNILESIEVAITGD